MFAIVDREAEGVSAFETPARLTSPLDQSPPFAHHAPGERQWRPGSKLIGAREIILHFSGVFKPIVSAFVFNEAKHEQV